MNDVTVVLIGGAGPFASEFTKLKWQYTERRDGEVARFAAAGFRAFVQDCDGDFSVWSVKRDKEVIAEGQDSSWEGGPHFFRCLGAAEQALRTAAGARLAMLRAQRIPPRCAAPMNFTPVSSAPADTPNTAD